jgi:TetR/AcrR family transcriptional regulator
MITTEPTATESKIKEAATRVFLTKGFDGTTTRAIATEAGMNLALVNYYFRSKEKLFTEIFEDMFRLMMEGMLEVFHRPLSLREKIVALIDHDFELFKKHPDLVIFVLSEVHRNPERFFSMIKLKHFQEVFSRNSFIHKELQEASNQKIIRPINPSNAVFTIMSSMHTIFSTKILLKHLDDMSEEEFESFSEAHKEISKNMLIKYLFEE